MSEKIPLLRMPLSESIEFRNIHWMTRGRT